MGGRGLLRREDVCEMKGPLEHISIPPEKHTKPQIIR